VVHHLACNIWPDLRTRIIRDQPASSEETSFQLLEAIVRKSQTSTLADLVCYHQLDASTSNKAPRILEPPECFQPGEPNVTLRKEWLMKLGKSELWDSIEAALHA